MTPTAMTPHGRAPGFTELVPTMSYNTREKREIEQKRNQLKDALARRGINPDGESEDTSVETLENGSEQSASDDDDVTFDTLLDEGYGVNTLNDEYAVQDRLDALNRKLDWYDRKGVTPPGNAKAERDALAKLQDERPEDGFHNMLEMRCAMSEDQ